MSRSLRVSRSKLRNLKFMIHQNGYRSQRALAEDVGLSLATVTNFLAGKPVDFCSFDLLAKALNADWKELSCADSGNSTEESNKLLPAAMQANPSCLSYPSGPLPVDSPLYIERTREEGILCRQICTEASFTFLVGEKGTGKTTLLIRVLAFAVKSGYKVIEVNVALASAENLRSIDAFLRWLCAFVSSELGVRECIDTFWSHVLGAKVSCDAYFREYIHAFISCPCVLAIDCIDRLLERWEVYLEFIGLLKAWEDTACKRSSMRMIRIVCVSRVIAADLEKLGSSAACVGMQIALGGFALKDAQRLALCYGYGKSKEESGELEELFRVSGGNPLRLQAAFYEVSLARNLSASFGA